MGAQPESASRRQYAKVGWRNTAGRRHLFGRHIWYARHLTIIIYDSDSYSDSVFHREFQRAAVTVAALPNIPRRPTSHSRWRIQFSPHLQPSEHTSEPLRGTSGWSTNSFRATYESIIVTSLRSPRIQLILTLTGICKRGGFAKRSYITPWFIILIHAIWIHECLPGILWISGIIVSLSTENEESYGFARRTTETHGTIRWLIHKQHPFLHVMRYRCDQKTIARTRDI